VGRNGINLVGRLHGFHPALLKRSTQLLARNLHAKDEAFRNLPNGKVRRLVDWVGGVFRLDLCWLSLLSGPLIMAKPSASTWRILSRHFRHQYELGFRYLDHCGEFMFRLVDELDFIAGDAQPTGAKMEHPDLRIQLELNVSGLSVSQNSPKDEQSEEFFRIVDAASAMAAELIKPQTIFYSGFATKLFQPYSSEDQVCLRSLAAFPRSDQELGEALSMNLRHQSVAYVFNSGSYDLQVSCKPISFNSARPDPPQNYGFRATEAQKRRVDRINASAAQEQPCGYALLLEADLREWNPPLDGLQQQYAELQKQLAVLQQQF